MNTWFKKYVWNIIDMDPNGYIWKYFEFWCYTPVLAGPGPPTRGAR